MAKDWLEGIEDSYDVVVVGSGLGGLTGANYLAKNGHKVLLLEHHYQFGVWLLGSSVRAAICLIFPCMVFRTGW